MIYEHGLISVGTAKQASLPFGAKLFRDVDGTLKRVKKIVDTKKGLLVLAGKHRVLTNEDDILVISYYDLAGENADITMRHSRLARLPMKDLPQQDYSDSSYAGLHCG